MFGHGFKTEDIIILPFFTPFHLELKVVIASHLQPPLCRPCHYSILFVIFHPLLDQNGKIFNVIIKLTFFDILLMITIIDVV
jgi:hypothetical protein